MSNRGNPIEKKNANSDKSCKDLEEFRNETETVDFTKGYDCTLFNLDDSGANIHERKIVKTRMSFASSNLLSSIPFQKSNESSSNVEDKEAQEKKNQPKRLSHPRKLMQRVSKAVTTNQCERRKNVQQVHMNGRAGNTKSLLRPLARKLLNINNLLVKQLLEKDKVILDHKSELKDLALDLEEVRCMVKKMENLVSILEFEKNETMVGFQH